jgi:hypothetical protein
MITVQEQFSGPRDYPLSGKYFQLLACSNPVDVLLSGESGSPDHVASQVTVGFYSFGPFDRVRIIASAAGDTVKFVVSDGEAGVALVGILPTVAGAPQGPDLDSANNRAFGGFGTGGPLAGNSGIVGVGNPAASGKRVYIDAMTFWVGAPTFVILSLSDNAQVGAGVPFRSRLAPGTVASHIIRSGTAAAVPGVATDKIQIDVANKPYRHQPSRAWIIDANSGFYVTESLFNTQLDVTFETREYPA